MTTKETRAKAIELVEQFNGMHNYDAYCILEDAMAILKECSIIDTSTLLNALSLDEAKSNSGV